MIRDSSFRVYRKRLSAIAKCSVLLLLEQESDLAERLGGKSRDSRNVFSVTCAKIDREMSEMAVRVKA